MYNRWLCKVKTMSNNFDEMAVSTAKITMLSGVDRSNVVRYVHNNGIKGTAPRRQGAKSSYTISTAREILSNFVSSRRIPRQDRKVLSFYNFKGGTGKTTICYHFATHLAICGYKVLLIDADPQGHLSSSLGFDTNDQYPTLYDVMVNKLPLNDVIQNVFDGLDCIPANLSLTKLETKINEMTRREERLRLDFKASEQYDFIIFDTNPTISMVNRNIAIFSDMINIVTETQPYSLHGLRMLLSDLDEFFASMDKEQPLIRIIPNKYEERTTSSAEAIIALFKMYKDKVLPDFAVRRTEDFVKSAKLGAPLALFCKPKSPALEDIVELIYLSLNDITVSKKEAALDKKVVNG